MKFDLNIDMSQYKVCHCVLPGNEEIVYRAYQNLVYAQNPRSPQEQIMNLWILAML